MLSPEPSQIQSREYFVPKPVTDLITIAISADDERITVRGTAANVSCMRWGSAMIFVMDFGHRLSSLAVEDVISDYSIYRQIESPGGLDSRGVVVGGRKAQ